MARNNLKTTKLPSIINIPINVGENLLNFKAVEIKKKELKADTLNAQKNEKEEASAAKTEKSIEKKEINESDDSDIEKGQEKESIDEKSSTESLNDFVTQTRKFPEFLQATAKFNFTERSLVLRMFAYDFDWSLVSITGLYDFHKTKINEAEFVEITGNDFVYNIAPTDGKIKAKVFKLDTSKIDRHVLMKQFSVTISYIFLDDVNMDLHNTTYKFDVPYFQNVTQMRSKFLNDYHADSSITKLYNSKFKLDSSMTADERNLLLELDKYHDSKLKGTVTTDSSTKIIKYALNIEDLSSQDELMKTNTIKNVTVWRKKDSKLCTDKRNYLFWIPKKRLPPNYKEMTLSLVPMDKYQNGMFNSETDSIYAQIVDFKKTKLYFETKAPPNRTMNKQNPRFRQASAIDLKLTYAVRFVPNRITYRACFQALDFMKQRLLTSFFDTFENEPIKSYKKITEKVENFEWINKSIETNEEQKTAVMNIVNCTAYPFPYVVFGPPGTGKTSLIVESIGQILKAKPNSRIMVTAQSNSACDEIGERLLKFISSNKIFRFYSPSLLNPQNGETSELLLKTSNLRNKRNQYPTKEEFYHFNVVIATLTSCSRLVQFEGIKINRHFDYIFLDEAATAMEPEAYVPIMGLGTDFQEITANIVLLGDHKQLGAVVSSKLASRLGLGESLMERVMSKRRYRMNEIDKSYDKNYVSQLLDNFRSHPAILQFSNVLFYDSKLRAKVGEPEKSLGTKWDLLNNKRFPIMFHCCKTPSKIQRGDTSSYNDGEVELVRFYVDSLLHVGIGGVKIVPDDIGVVSPYKAQLNKLRQKLNHEKKVEIGTAEYYQGREKKIIIISTVKSHNHVGFLKCEKRLNVCITRAKSLLILVGNADTLQQDSLWNSFMHFCKANDGCCGEDFELKRLTDEEKKILDELNSVFSQLKSEETMDIQPAFDRHEQLKAIEERMAKLELLTQKV